MNSTVRHFPILALSIVLLGGCDAAERSASAATTVSDEDVESASSKSGPEPATDAPSQVRKTGVTTFDFVANRHLAHFWDGGLVLDLGHASGTKYVQGRWNSPWYDSVELDGKQVGYPRGVSGTVRFPALPKSDADRWKVEVRLAPEGSQRCDLFLSEADGEESKIGSLNAIEDGWGTYEVEIDRPKLGQEQTLRLHFSRSRPISGGRRSAAAIDWIRVGPVESADAEPRTFGEIFDSSTGKISLEEGESLTWYTVIGQGAAFVTDLEGSGELVVAQDGAEPVTHQLKEGVAVDLTEHAGTAVRLELRATGESAVMTRPRLTTEHGTIRARQGKPKVILVWVIDTLRADYLPAYNPDTDVVTPHLDAFVEEAALFASATAQGNSSLPTSASIFTGAHTVRHQLVRESGRLSKEHKVLGEPFAEAGWQTGLFSSNGYVSNTWGFARGFDTEVNPIRESRPSDTSVLWPEAREWLEASLQKDEPIFLYINTVDPHVPYDPPASQLRRYHSGGRVGKVTPRGTGQLLHDAAAGKVDITPAERAYMLALYKGEITDNDAWFGRMRKDLDELGIADETMIVVTSDHGEEFGEYGRYGHGVSVNQELVDIPFIVGFRPWTKPGVRIDDAVEVIDLYPTVVDAAGLESGPQVQGTSLVGWMLDGTPRHPSVAFSYHNDFLRGARVGTWKYQLFNGDNDRVYDLTDRDGTWDDENVAAERPIVRRAMRDAMAFQVGFDETWEKSRHGFVNNHSENVAKMLDDEGW